MNWICWLTGHRWHEFTLRTGDPIGGPATYQHVMCARCRVAPYDDVTLHEWWLNLYRFTLSPKIKRVRTWLRSRPCWVKDHDWHPASDICRRCGMTGTEVAERGEWTLPEWKKLWRPWLHDRFFVVPPAPNHWRYAVQAFNWRFGIERSTVYIRGEKYLLRYIAYLGPIGLRLHKFYRGDDDRASHTHPWPFITFPFSDYVQRVFQEGAEIKAWNVVRRFRFHYRSADFEHIVIGPLKNMNVGSFWTFVITGPIVQTWGFYPKPGKFVPWQEYKS